jgi:Flp pilus assembly protein TadG
MSRGFSCAFDVAQSTWRRLRRDESGSVLAYMVGLPVLAGALAIGVETGELYRVKHQMQAAADDAVLVAAFDIINGKSASATADAIYEAQRSGFTNGANTVNVAVNIPPTQGPNVSTPNAVEVVVTKTQSLAFAKVLNPASNGYALTVRAVAIPVSTSTTINTTTTTTSTSSVGCMVALTPNPEQGISLSSFNNFGADCAIISNGSAQGTAAGTASIGISAFNNFTLSGDGMIWSRGSLFVDSYIHFTPNATLLNQTSAIVDPYSGLGAPSPGACTYTNYTPPSGNSVTLQPGTYCGGLIITNKSVNFSAGTYYIANGDLVITSPNNVSCSNCSNGAGTTFVLTQTSGSNSDIGGVRISSDNNITLNAPNSGPYKGVLFYQDSRVPAGTQKSTSKIFTVSSLNNATLSGAVYIPNNAIDIANINNFGGTPSTGCTIWVGRYLNFSGFNNNYKGGCKTFGTTPVGIQTTTTTTTPTTTTTTKATLAQ